MLTFAVLHTQNLRSFLRAILHYLGKTLKFPDVTVCKILLNFGSNRIFFIEIFRIFVGIIIAGNSW